MVYFFIQEFVLKKLIAGRSTGIKTVHVKMAVIALYDTIVGSMSLVTFTYFEVKSKPNRDSLESLFLCESRNLDCTDINLEGISTLNLLGLVAIVFVAFLPVVAVLFSFNPKIVTRWRRKLKF